MILSVKIKKLYLYLWSISANEKLSYGDIIKSQIWYETSDHLGADIASLSK